MYRKCSTLVMFLLCVSAFAQTNRGGISGNVTDSTGAIVPNASVTITNIGTNETRKLTTNNQGSFLQENLEPVVYRIEVQASGFKKSVLENVKVDTSSVVTANLVLQPGNVDTQVTVTANSSLINTESGTLGQTISQRALTDTPLPNRSVLDLAITVPNVSGDVGSEDPQLSGGPPLPGYNLQVNGGRAGSTSLLADGINNTGVGLAREVVSFAPEDVQEFTVQTNGFDAEYGRSDGGVISVTTKSGTNEYHGLALWYLRNPDTNAAPFTQAAQNRPVNNLRWNQFDGQLGGPVVIPKLYNGRNKTFFFFSGEPRYQRDKQQKTAFVPTDAMRNGDFSNLVQLNGQAIQVPVSLEQQFPASAFLPSNNTTIYNQFNASNGQFTIASPTGTTYPAFSGNKIPVSMMDPVALKLFQYVPKQNAAPFLDSNGILEDYVTYQYLLDDATRYNMRVDQNFGDRNHLNFRWTTVPEVGSSALDPNYPMNGSSGTFSSSSQYLLSDTHIISPTIVNELRLAYTRANFSGQLSPQYDVTSGQNLSTQNGLPSLTKGGVPLINIYDNTNSNANIGSQVSTLGYNLEQQYEIADNVYITRGGHTWKFGVDLSRDLLNTESLYGAAGGNYQFRYIQTDNTGAAGTQAQIGGSAIASFLLGVPQQVTLANAPIPYYYRWNSGAAYVQNDWKVRPNLTLNIGLRYSLQLPRTEVNNLQGFFDPAATQTVSLPKPCPLPDCNASSTALGLGTVTQATIIPFAYSGYGGRSRYLTPIHWMNFEPRFGFAYTPHVFGLNAWVVRGGYGISHAPLTGQNRNPVPSLGGTVNVGETSGQVDPNYVMRVGTNPPYNPAVSPQQVLGLTNNPSGMIYNGAINIPANILTGETAVSYVQNWSLSFQRQTGSKGVLELAYTGAKGTHLFMPAVVTNNAPQNYLAALQNLNVKATTTVPDPLGRKTVNGATFQDVLYTLASPYLGYNQIATYYDASGNSTFHAAIASYKYLAGHGLTMYTNFRWSKSLDDASDASPDKFALTTGSVGGGQYSFGGTAAGDKSVSTFNIPYDWNLVAIYDLPFGKGKAFGSRAPAPLRSLLGDWTVAGVERLASGYPFTPTIATDNFIDTVHTHEIRPDIVPGVPVVNPAWSRSCPTTNQCPAYVNTSAFELPPAGQIGNAPRTLSMATGPMVQTLDMSVQKSWRIGEKRSIQLRVDALNVLNHPVFRNVPDVGGGTDIFQNYPSFAWTSTTLQSTFNSWMNAYTGSGPKPTAADSAAFQNMVLGLQNSHGTLPANFYTVQLPANFATTNANSFDIRNLNGFKYYEIRQNLNTGGQLTVNPLLNQQRYLQFGIRIFF